MTLTKRGVAVRPLLLVLLLSGCTVSTIHRDTRAAHAPQTHDAATYKAMQQREARARAVTREAVADYGDCRQPPTYVVEAANTQLATTLAQRYAERFQARQLGNYVLFQPREDDEFESVIGARAVEEARFELDGTRSDDPLQSHNEKLWESIRMPAPRALQPGEPVNVAVLDGPVRADHPDLGNVVYIEPRLRDADGSCGQADCCPQVTAPAAFWHGTRIAGVIGATRGNRIGTAGIAPVRTLVSINANVGGCAGELSLAAALHCAIEYRDSEGRPVRVANISMGSTQPLATTALTTALQRARNQNLLVVASAGNKGSNIDTLSRWPSSSNEPNIITVQSRRYDGSETKTGNYGFGTVDIGAPAPMGYEGGGLCTASTPQRGSSECSGDYAPFEQSSAAAAVVSGAAALVWSDRRFADCSAEQMRTLLMSTGRHCISGHSYREDTDYAVCQLDLGFLSDRNTSALQALCRRD